MAISAAEFRKLLTYDLVKLDIPSQLDALVPILTGSMKTTEGADASAESVRAALRTETGHRTVVCRVEAPASGEPPTLKATIRSITVPGPGTGPGKKWIKLANGDPIPFYLVPAHVNTMAPGDSLATLCHNDRALSMQAITHPATFLQKKCAWEWLPSQHSRGTPSVRDRLPPRSDGEEITEDAMLALLEFRMLTTQRLREWIQPIALQYSKDKRRTAALDAGLSAEVAEEFAKKAKTFGGSIPGSTELSSDIDMNTFNHGTEFVVREFNALFRARFGGWEPGSVFDVNVYAKDFLPNFGRDENWRRTAPADPPGLPPPPKRIRPEFDHEFTTLESEQADAILQLRHGLTKLRRYMVDAGEGSAREASWSEFCRSLETTSAKPLLLRPMLSEARVQHLEWNHWVVATSRAMATGAVPALTAPTNDVLLASETAMAALPRRDAIRAQNALYEYVLREEVEEARMTLALLKEPPAGGVPPPDLAERTNTAYRELRDVTSRSLYFANEAYVTCGGVLQVVGGKQQKSRKVSDDYKTKDSLHNIAYSVHELIQSAVDQLADIHKEAHRDFAHHPLDLGGVLLATGKYIHRLMNALKHMYRILGTIAPVGKPKPFYLYPYRPSGGNGLAWWKDLTNFAYGLEALKKTDLRKAIVAINALRVADEGGFVELTGPALTQGAAFILVKKFNLSRVEFRKIFAREFLPEGFTDGDVKTEKTRIAKAVAGLKRISSGRPRALTIFLDLEHYYEFFNSLVQNALVDYSIYLADRYHDLPRLRGGVLRPNCPVDAHFVGNDALVDEVPPAPVPVPVRLMAAAADDAWLDEDDEDYEEAE